MLKELTRSDWLRILDIPEALVPEVLLLRGTRVLAAACARHAALLADVVELRTPNDLFEHVLIGRRGETRVGYASVYGAPMAAEITHLFAVLGTRVVIQTGCCGAMGPGILPGDVVCATAAHCGEGAAQYYLPGARLAAASPELVEHAAALLPEGVNFHRGPIWTTAALLAEGREELEHWAGLGCIAVDMETAATFAAAEHFRMGRLSLLYTYDNPLLDGHILATGEELRARRLAGDRAMLDLTLALVEQVGRE